jgi:hypothetical protein
MVQAVVLAIREAGLTPQEGEDIFSDTSEK